jgi:hypothetical protein
MLSRLHRPAHRADVNWAPLSDVKVAGTPNPKLISKDSEQERLNSEH